MAITVGTPQEVIIAGGTSISASNRGLVQGDQVLAFIGKDDDTATTVRPTGFETALLEGESNNNIYAEVYLKDVTSADTANDLADRVNWNYGNGTNSDADGTLDVEAFCLALPNSPFTGGGARVASYGPSFNKDGSYTILAFRDDATNNVYFVSCYLATPYVLESWVPSASTWAYLMTNTGAVRIGTYYGPYHIYYMRDNPTGMAIAKLSDTNPYTFDSTTLDIISSTTSYPNQPGSSIGIEFSDDLTEGWYVTADNIADVVLIYKVTGTPYNVNKTFTLVDDTSLPTQGYSMSGCISGDGTRIFIARLEELLVSASLSYMTFSTAWDWTTRSSIDTVIHTTAFGGNTIASTGSYWTPDFSRKYSFYNQSAYWGVWSPTALTWDGDSEEYFLYMVPLSGVDVAATTAAANNKTFTPLSGTATPGSSVTVSADNFTVIGGLCIDGDSTPISSDGTALGNSLQTSTGAGSSGGMMIYEASPSTPTHTTNYTLDSADETLVWQVALIPLISGSAAMSGAADVFAALGDVLVQGDIAVLYPMDTFAATANITATATAILYEAPDTIALEGTQEANGDLLGVETTDTGAFSNIIVRTVNVNVPSGTDTINYNMPAAYSRMVLQTQDD